MSRYFAISILLLSGVSAIPQAVQAQDYNQMDYVQTRKSDSGSNWDVTVGGGALVLPEYEGSDEYEVLPVPYVDASYKEILTFNPFEGLRYNVFREGGLTLGPGLGFDFGREDDEGDRLRGMGDIDPTIEGQFFVNYEFGKSSAEITFAQDLFEGHEGYTVEAELGHAFVFPSTYAFVRPSISTTYASDNYMESYFGVSQAQSQRSGNAAHNADAGFKDVSLNLFASMPITEKWSVNGLAGYSRLIGDAGDSPITESRNQLMGGGFVSYKF